MVRSARPLLTESQPNSGTASKKKGRVMPAPCYRMTTNLVPSSARRAQRPLRDRRDDLRRFAERGSDAELGLRVAFPDLRHHRRQLAFQMRALREEQRHDHHRLDSFVGETRGCLVKRGRHELEESEL